ncbi:MAG: hypothetical protein ACTHN5_01035 [Phycisphaerae bacterium]
MEKLEEYNDITTRIVSETVACTPEEWTHGTLTIDCDGTRIDYKLKNAEQPGMAVISDKLRSLCEELYVRMARHGDRWTQATIRFDVENGEAKFKNTFQCASAEPSGPSLPQTSPEPSPAHDVHNQPLQRTVAAEKRSWVQKLFGRGPGR